MLVIAGYAYVKAEKLEAALPIIAKMIAASEAEAGCISYRFYRDFHEPTKFFIFEEWHSVEDLDAHFQTPHMDEFRKHLPDLLASEMIIKQYDVSNTVDM